jgi:hypothetical protein
LTMFKPRRLAALVACAVLCAPYVANAAVVASVTGNVLVSTGDGFARISGATELAPGGRVLVQPGGLAMITYPSDCVVRVGCRGLARAAGGTVRAGNARG